MRYEVYPDKAGFWRWRLKVNNGDILADSGEGYYNKSDCYRCIQVVSTSGDVQVVELTRK